MDNYRKNQKEFENKKETIKIVIFLSAFAGVILSTFGYSFTSSIMGSSLTVLLGLFSAGILGLQVYHWLKNKGYLKNEIHKEDYYSIRSFCPNCGFCNYTNYLKGKVAYGNEIKCGKCGNTYRHK
jgi:hypothetical protein